MVYDYQNIVNDAMVTVVRKVLQHIEKNGLVEDQSLYISFKTKYPEVILSKKIKTQYPDEITIVLQYQYKNLIVHEDQFWVDIVFNGVNETVKVPFFALTSFIDQLTNFSLQFSPYKQSLSSSMQQFPTNKINTKSDVSISNVVDQRQKGEIVSLNHFRNKADNRK